jgi:hypothetical protein
MSDPIGVAAHPARAQMAELWGQGFRAAEILRWLAEHGYDLPQRSSLARYGQRYWNESVTVQVKPGESPAAAVEKLTEEIEQGGLGLVKSAEVTRKSYTGWRRDAQGTQALSEDQTTDVVKVSYSPAPTSVVERAPMPEVNLFHETSSERNPIPGWRTLVFLPDMQIGYYEEDGGLYPLQCESSIDLAHQIMLELEVQEGVDVVVNAGDNTDLASLGTHRSGPNYVTPAATQAGIDRTALEAAVQRKISPLAVNKWFEGNHERRLTNILVDKIPALVGLRRADEPNPLLSIPHLCRFDDFDIDYISPYPDGEWWANDWLKFEHGSSYSSVPGTTARNQLKNQGVSVGYGHTHRAEVIYERRNTQRGSRLLFAGSPGCLARVDGMLPSAKTGITADGGQAGGRAENWQNGIWIIHYEPEGEQRSYLEAVPFDDGKCFFRGKLLEGDPEWLTNNSN